MSTMISCSKIILSVAIRRQVGFCSIHNSGVLTSSSKNNGSSKSPEPKTIKISELLEEAQEDLHYEPSHPDQVWLKSPYSFRKIREQSRKTYRPKTDPSQTSIILFPGQGTQYVGMGKALLKVPSVVELYKNASQILGYDLLKLCLEGPKEKLDKTVYAQPAVFVTSLAALELMMEERRGSVESCIATAGFSIGEFAALVFAEALTFETALKLVNIRAQAMQEMCDQVPSGMMTLFINPFASMGKILEKAIESCKAKGIEYPVCSVANFLYPHCRVVGGNSEALDFIENNMKELDVRKVKRLAVAGAFHTQLMWPAAQKFRKALSKCEITDPSICVHSNVHGKLYQNSQAIRSWLPKQIFLPVRWEQTMHILLDREKDVPFPNIFECGPGNSLTTLIGQQNRLASANCRNVSA